MGQSAHTTINIPVHGPPTELENILQDSQHIQLLTSQSMGQSAHTTINIPVHGTVSTYNY